MSEDLREQLLATARAMNGQGLNQGTSGNVSVREGEGFFITPSALAYDQCWPEDVVWLDGEGTAQGKRRPSSEWRMHSDIYHHFPQAGAILHAHSLYCTTLACLQRSIPAIHYMVAVAGGDSIRCTPYALFGSQELSDAAVAGLQDRSATLLGHHGMICYAPDLTEVLALAIEVEALARIYLQALQVCEPTILSATAMAEVLERFAAYKSV